MTVWFGYHMPSYSVPGASPETRFDRIVELAQAAEAAGFSLVTVMDHLYQIQGVGPETEPMLEAYSTLAALSQRTTKVRLATLVTGVTYRNPALLAKMVTTLDTLSKGRALLGLGAAWNWKAPSRTASSCRTAPGAGWTNLVSAIRSESAAVAICGRQHRSSWTGSRRHSRST